MAGILKKETPQMGVEPTTFELEIQRASPLPPWGCLPHRNWAVQGMI